MFCRTLRGVDRIRLASRPSLDGRRKVCLYVGSTGTGKTKAAYEQYPDLYELPINSKGDLWFDGYQGEDTVLFDEFKGALPLDALLKLLDPYYIRKVPIKCSFTWFNPKRIIVTSNFHPEKWYDYTGREEHQLALRRRFDEVIFFGKNDSRLVYTGAVFIQLYWPCEKKKDDHRQLINNRCIYCNYSPCNCNSVDASSINDVFGEDTEKKTDV